MPSVRILIADDHEIVRRGIRSLFSLRPDWDVCGEAVDGREAVEKAKLLLPDVVLLDISMPFLNGFEAARIIRREVPQSRVLIVSQYDATHMRTKALEAGACGYVAKSDLSRELLAVVQATLDERPSQAPEKEAAEQPRISPVGPKPALQMEALPECLPADEITRSVSNARASESARGQAEVRSHLAAIVESSDDAIISKDLDGTILTWNKGAQRLFGYLAEEAIGRSITLIIPPELRDEENRILKSIGNGERIEHFETVRVTKSGARVHVSLSVSPLRDASGNIVGASKIARDITERRQNEQALRNVQDELEARVKERTLDLERAEENLRILSGRLLQMQDEERRRIARELHDTAGQVMAALNMNLSPLEEKLKKIDPALAKPVTESIELVNDLSVDLRTISHLLHPPLLDEAGLASALQWFVEGFAERSRIPIDLDLSADFGRLTPEMETTIFRVVQECLTNVHRHSGSATASISIKREAKGIRLEIRDYGKGIRKTRLDPARSGVGIQGMRERVRQLNGQFSIQSSNTGTVVTVVLPESSSPTRKTTLLY